MPRLALAALGLVLLLLPAAGAAPPPPTFEAADKLLKDEHWAEAQQAYDRLREAEKDWHSPAQQRAVSGGLTCALKLKQWDDALARATLYAERTKGSLEEALARRRLGRLHLELPHHGTLQGGKLRRGEYGQGVRVSTWKKDRRAAVREFEAAREILRRLKDDPTSDRAASEPNRAARLTAERIGLNFDLATALARPDQENWDGYWPWRYCGWWWDSWRADEEEDSAAVEEADYEEPRGWRRYGRQEEPLPNGIPLGPDGKPQFPELPKTYGAHLGSGPKIRFLLAEIQQLDDSPKREDAARALFRWAMIARSLYGPETADLTSRNVRYDRRGRPLPPVPDPDAPSTRIWELADDEALTIVGGKVRVVALPPGESPVALLRRLETEFPASDQAVEARYARALYLQSRQQFPQALAEYEALLAAHPKHPRAAAARNQISFIREPGVALGSSGVQLPGAALKIFFTSRNAAQVQLHARRFDLTRYVQDRLEQPPNENYWNYRQMPHDLLHREGWEKYLGESVGSWHQPVTASPANRVIETSTTPPFQEPGAYLIEAALGKDIISRTLVLVTDLAIVQKDAAEKGLLLVVDARTGQPLPNKAVRIYEHWSVYDPKTSKSTAHFSVDTLQTDRDGLIEYSRRQRNRGSQVDAMVVGEKGRLAFSFFQHWSEATWQDFEAGRRCFVITDRPVYRPGSKVRFRVWLRERQKGQLQLTSARTLRVEIRDAKGNSAGVLRPNVDEMGAASGEFELAAEPPLGLWQIRVDGDQPDARTQGGGKFRVEEYKKPEFAVTVQPSDSQARPGEPWAANIAARYYFGAPVAGARVSYKVFREAYTHIYLGSGEFDWLYGRGYGRASYAYPWFPWWARWGGWMPWPLADAGDEENAWQRRLESGTRRPLRELVTQGEAILAADGTHRVEVDPSRLGSAATDRDHRYTIEAEVRDASRRTIAGQGSLLVTREEFYAFVETSGGWYRPGNEAFLEIRTLTPDNVPVAAKGELVVARLRSNAAAERLPTEEIVRRWPAETDADGRLSSKIPLPGEGQYRVTFQTRDARRREVQGNAVFWVCGPKFDGRVYRFNDLEIVTDKRTYKIGETARLLINVAESGAHVLFSDDASQGLLRAWRMLKMEGRSTVLEVPIEARHVPNFFVEATLVRNGRVHSEAREILVPPAQGLLDVRLTTDKASYRPGEKGRVRAEVKDAAGRPASGEITLAAFDEAITYIQEEFGPAPRAFFHGQRRWHRTEADSSLQMKFPVTSRLILPQQLIHVHGAPVGWHGDWGFESDDGAGGAFNFRVATEDRRAQLGANASPNTRYSIVESMTAGAKGRQEVAFSASYYDRADADRPSEPTSAYVEPEVRTNFVDTALWQAGLKLNAQGVAETEIELPQSLTTWRLRGFALTKSTQVGDATARVTTKKDVIVRLQSPRFFVERDEAVLSANVHNYLASAQKVRAELILPAALFEYLGDQEKPSVPDAEGNLHLLAEATVAANGEHRFDWPVKVRQAGLARITIKALTGTESDAMRLAFPVLVHGVNKQLVQSGAFQPAQNGERTLAWTLPAEIDPEQSRLELTFSPSLAGAMVDALPYLVGYPYGCVEQTMSRFYPTVLVVQTLKKLGTDLETIGQQRRQAAADLSRRYGHSPVFDSAEVARMTSAGLQRLYNFQRSDGGWGWWREDESSPHQTAYVLQGLHAARAAGVEVDGGSYSRGFQYLQNYLAQELARPKADRNLGHLTSQAALAYTLSLERRFEKETAEWLDGLLKARGEMNQYGRALLALTLAKHDKLEDARLVLRNVLQFLERDDSNETAWVRTPGEGWWFWYQNDIETNAWVLRALVALEPKSELAPRLVKWLLNNRRGGHYWRSTRDTALVLAALGDYLRLSGEDAPDYQLDLAVDGVPIRSLRVTKENFFTFDNRLSLHGLHLKPGPHTIQLTKSGPGALYYSGTLSYFTKEQDIKGAGHEIAIERTYFKLVPRVETVRLPEAATAANRPGLQPAALETTGRAEQRAGFTRVPLAIGDKVSSGDQIEVVLTITAKNTYDYLAFEDMKPAGCEPVELRSGGRWAGGLCANVELRDTKVVFFIGLLQQGRHILRYRLRAETPGHFHALPASGFAMYAPEVRAISDEMRLRVAD